MQKSEELSLRDAVVIVGRRWWAVALAALVLGGLTYGFFKGQTPMYRTESVLLLDLNTSTRLASAAGQGVGFRDADRTMLNEVEFARSKTVRDAVVAKLGTPIDGDIEVRSSDSDTITFTAEASDPGRSVLLANTFASEYQALTAQRTADTYAEAVASVDAVLAPIKARLAELAPLTDGALLDPKTPVDPTLLAERRRLEADLQSNEAKRTALQLAAELDTGVPSRLISPAEMPEGPESPKPVRNGLIGFVAGLVLATAGAFLADYFDDRLRDRAAIAKATPNLPTLAIIPRNRRAARSSGGLAAEPGPAGEAVRGLRAAVQFAALSAPVKSLMVTSSRPKEGKSTVAASLAVAFARNGTPTVLIDADLRRPRVHRLFGLPDNGVGLSTVMQGAASLEKVMRPAPGVDQLYILPAGPSPTNPADFLWSGGTAASRITIEHVVAKFADSGYFVVVDVPPVLPVADALTVARAVDGVVFVVAAESARDRDVRRAFELLGQAGANVLGLAVNKAKRLGGGYGGNYAYTSRGAANGQRSTNGHRPAEVINLASGPSYAPAGRGQQEN